MFPDYTKALVNMSFDCPEEKATYSVLLTTEAIYLKRDVPGEITRSTGKVLDARSARIINNLMQGSARRISQEQRCLGETGDFGFMVNCGPADFNCLGVEGKKRVYAEALPAIRAATGLDKIFGRGA